VGSRRNCRWLAACGNYSELDGMETQSCSHLCQLISNAIAKNDDHFVPQFYHRDVLDTVIPVFVDEKGRRRRGHLCGGLSNCCSRDCEDIVLLIVLCLRTLIAGFKSG
jgi:hypothetical protein